MLAAEQSRRILRIAKLAIFTIGLGFAIRAGVAAPIQETLFAPLSPQHSGEWIGEALGLTFAGFAFMLLFGSALVDRVGARAMLLASAWAYLLGSALALSASMNTPGLWTYRLIAGGFFLTGLGWGAVESASNPLVASLSADDKVARLNALHAWWPAGIIVGGVSGVLLASLALPWQVNFVFLIVPSLWLILRLRRVQMPVTERVAQGISDRDMYRELLRKPLFWLYWCCMWITASAELAPGQWVDVTLSRVVGMNAMWILVYVSALMFVMRHFAGALTARFSTPGLLALSCALASAGLFGLSHAQSPALALAAATLWGTGVCFLWPTMLGVVAERFPRGGALFLGLMGFGGGLAIHFLLPLLGRVFDTHKQAALLSAPLALAADAKLAWATQLAASASFETVAWLPLLLVPVFIGLMVWERRTHGQK